MEHWNWDFVVPTATHSILMATFINFWERQTLWSTPGDTLQLRNYSSELYLLFLVVVSIGQNGFNNWQWPFTLDKGLLWSGCNSAETAFLRKEFDTTENQACYQRTISAVTTESNVVNLFTYLCSSWRPLTEQLQRSDFTVPKTIFKSIGFVPLRKKIYAICSLLKQNSIIDGKVA